MQQRRYIVRKYVMAKSLAEALRLEGGVRPEEIFIDEKWLELEDSKLKNTLGFKDTK